MEVSPNVQELLSFVSHLVNASMEMSSVARKNAKTWSRLIGRRGFVKTIGFKIPPTWNVRSMLYKNVCSLNDGAENFSLPFSYTFTVA